MSRPKQKRIVANPPTVEGFKPFGIPITDLEPIILLYEEYEAIRLADYEFLTQEQASQQMMVSRPTFTRIYENARRSIAKAFIEGKAIFIEGGDYHSDHYWYRCEDCQKINISVMQIDSCTYCNSKNMKQLNEMNISDEPGVCICVHCALEFPHEKGMPCRDGNCPSCGKRMMRKGSYHHQLHIKKQQKI